MSFSNDFVINVNKKSSIESPKWLMTIEHYLLPEPVRLIQDNDDLVSRSNNYVAFPFELDVQPDVESELPKAKLSISNVGRELVRWIEETFGANNATVTFELVRRTDPDTVELTLPCSISSTTLKVDVVEIDLVVLKDALTQRGIRFSFLKRRTPSIF